MRINFLSKVQRFIVMTLAVLIPSLTFAQSYVLRGVVVDENDVPLPGTTIIKQGTADGTITGAGGVFELEVSKGEVLTCSFIGYLDKDITVAGQTTLNVQLDPNANQMDDVVVVGYGRMRKADVTAAITSVDVDELKSVATTDPMAALQGRVSGVNIQKSSGLAGSSTTVRIRGVSTFGSNEPLYIIDGFPGDISSVSPNDIESLQILKDGAAAAIYGSEAANGVVIITTKSGKSGDVIVNFNAYASVTKIANQLEFLDTAGYQQVQSQMYNNKRPDSAPDYATTPTGVNTNWQDEIYRNGFAQNYSVNVSGGSENVVVAAGATFSDEEGMTIGNEYKRQDAYVKAQFKKNIFTFDTKISYNGYEYTDPTYSLADAYRMSPIVPVYSEDKDSADSHNRYGLTADYGVGDLLNPIAMHENTTDTRKKQAVVANASVTIDFTDWLSFKSGYSYSVDNRHNSFHSGSYTAGKKAPVLYPVNSDTRFQFLKQNISNTLTFDKRFGKHSLNVMLGTTVDMNDYNIAKVSVEGKKLVYSVDADGNLQESTESAGFPDQSFTTINAGSGGTYTGSGYYEEYNRMSYFGRVNYNYGNRYLFQGTVRRDASSYFGKNNRWGTFPSLAVGWRVTQEDFFPENTPINELKLRASWGQLGNESALSPYMYETLMTPSKNMHNGASVIAGNPWLGMTAFDMANPDLRWETTESINAGLDYALYDNRLSGSFNYYQTTTRDLLIRKQVPPSTGTNSPIMNIGTIRNKGIEFELRWAETRGDWDYNVGLVVSTTNNKVLKLDRTGGSIQGDNLVYGGHIPTTTEVGQSIGAFKLYETAGIFQTDDEAKNYTFTDKDGNVSRIQPKAKAGDIKYVDVNQDGKIDGNDKTFQGTGIPKAEVSINLGFRWKGVDFSALIGSGWGHQLYNGNKFQYGAMNSAENSLAYTLDAWTPSNTNTDVPRAILGDPNQNSLESDRYLEKGDFIRLRQVQLGYTLPASATNKIFIDKVRFYVSAENPFTWTNYTGVDPEFASSLLNTGVDSFIYPFTSSYVFGVQLTF